MKTTTRIISLLLAVLMLAVVFVSCAETTTPTPTNQPTAKPTGTGEKDGFGEDDDFTLREAEKPEEVANLSFDGEDIGIWISAELEEYVTRSLFFGEEEYGSDPNNNVDLQVEARNKAVEADLGVTLSYWDCVGGGDLASALNEYLPSADGSVDIVCGYQFYDLGLAFGKLTGTFVNLNAIPEEEMHIDVTNEYWDKGIYDLIEHEGAAYWVTGDVARTWISQMYVTVVNKKMWDEAKDKIAALTESGGYEDIYELVKAGYWTLDLWYQLDELFYSDEGPEGPSIEDTVVFTAYSGESGINNVIVDALSAGCGVSFSTIGSDGIPTIKFNTKSTKNWFEAADKLYNQTNIYDYPYDSEYTVMDHFATDRVLITCHTLSRIELELSESEIQYYVLPLPKLNQSQKEYITSLGDNTNHFAILNTSGVNIEACTAVLELMAWYSFDMVTPAYYEDAVKGAFLRDETNLAEGARMIDFIHEGLRRDFAEVWGAAMGDIGKTPTHFLRTSLSDLKGNSTTTVIGQQERTWQRKLDDLLQSLTDAGEI